MRSLCIFLTLSILGSINSSLLLAQDTPPFWSLAGNSTASTTSKLGTTNSIPLRFLTKNAERMRIDTFGRVGIGTTNPVNILTVRLSGSTPIASWLSGGSSPAFIAFGENMSTGSNLVTASNIFNHRPVLNARRSRGTLASPTAVVNNDFLSSFVASGYDGSNFQNPATIDFYVDGTPTAGNVPARISLVTGSNVGNRLERLKVGSTGNFTFNNSQLFLRQSDGNIGIATTNPGARLHVILDDQSTSTAAIAASLNTDGNFGIAIRASGGEYGVYATASHRGGGGTGVFGTGEYIGVEGIVSEDGYAGVYGEADPVVGAAAGYFNGDVWATGYNFITSDRKFKTDISPVKSGSLEKLMKLKPSAYKFKADEFSRMHFPQGNQIGLIADELKQVFPELVKAGFFPPEYSKDKSLMHPAVKYEGINYVGLIPVLIGSIQEQQQQIKEQQKQIESLEQIINQLMQQKNVTTSITNVSLEQNNPNPVAGNTTIRYQIPVTATSAKVAITNIKGQLIKAITIGSMGAGQVNFNSATLASGTYNYSLWVDGKQMETKQLIIIK